MQIPWSVFHNHPQQHIHPDGSLNNDSAARAILQYRNTPIVDINLSPAQILLHRQLRDAIPESPSHYKPHKDWVLSAKDRELALAQRNHRIVEQYNSTARPLSTLPVETHVVVQSQDINRKKRWVKTGKIVEVLINRQYRICMDHSGRVTLQNRKYIKKCLPINPPMPIPTPDATNQATTDADTRQQSNVLPNEVQQPPNQIQPQMEIVGPGYMSIHLIY